ncbi:ABC transporter ATP-binding protein [uncultured Nevskia sp.]|uniref:ABC transporter ATP-binding protein n=1 Tax=uncultured Nevskia sp. TaxID=228950 RepID=UPI0025D0B199|nr:ABC transporter ATP-binding protein [uncultured Nevskia sp.]
MSASVIATGLVHAFGSGPARSPVLQRLSAEFEPGEVSLVMGASGSGKSTLLAAIGGLLRPDRGEVRIAGIALWSLTARSLERFRYQRCGYIFQGFNLFPALTALDQVALPLRFGGVAKSTAKARAEASLAEVGLEARLHLRPAELSGGEKQRVAIARALVTKPQVLFADEPTSALDSRNGTAVIALLQDIAHALGTTVIVVTHDARLIRHAERVLQIDNGRITSDERLGTPAKAIEEAA